MATYKGIQGYSVQTVASDPSPTASVVGQLWYNSTSSSYKIAIAGSGVWAAGGSRNTGVQGAPGAGAQTAAITMGGNLLPGVLTYNCETYDGTSWSEVSNINSRRYNGSDAGTTTAALLFGGTDNLPPGTLMLTEAYDGTSWSEVNDLLTGNTHMTENIGIQTAALSVGGSASPNATNVLYNGTCWSEQNDLNTGRSGASGCGTTTAALICCGDPSTTSHPTETYNGTSWSTGNSVNTPRASAGSAMQASNTTALIFGGATPGSTDKTEEFDGTSWAEVGDLSGPITNNAGFGTGTAALTVSGLNSGPPSITLASQEWNSPVLSIKTVTVT